MIEVILQNFLYFILIVSFIVFIHEFGHFYIARLCGVKVEEFSIGFGKEMFGFYDKKGTRWKFCIFLIGGYVKMFGDGSAASNPDFKKIENFNKKEKSQSFIFKNVYQKIAIVAAGPLANFVLAIAIFTIIFRVNGISQALPIIDKVMKDSAAENSGIQSGDKILAINNEEIEDFSQVQQIIALGTEKDLTFTIARNDKVLNLKITPKIQKTVNIFGEETQKRIIGITSGEVVTKDANIFQSFLKANSEVFNISKAILTGIGDLLTGKRSVKELGGPIKIAKYSGKSVDLGIFVVLWFMAMISINLGIINLLPLPALDGGHLVFYFYEAIFKKPMKKEVQEVAFRFGFAIILTLMIFTICNDVYQLLN